MAAIESRFRVDGKVAVVTGASSGLGAGFAKALAEAGADLVLGARRVDRLEETRAAIAAMGRRVIAIATDVSKPESCQALIDGAMAEFGKVDILINNAGVGTAIPALKETPEEFSEVIDINLKGSYWMAQSFARVALPGSSIVNVSSILGFRPLMLPQAAYVSSKAAVIGLTRDLSLQWAGRKGIRVNALAPGLFASEMTEQMGDHVAGLVAQYAPLGRIGEQEELDNAMLFLASGAASYISGVVLPVDGGLTMS